MVGLQNWVLIFTSTCLFKVRVPWAFLFPSTRVSSTLPGSKYGCPACHLGSIPKPMAKSQALHGFSNPYPNPTPSWGSQTESQALVWGKVAESALRAF